MLFYCLDLAIRHLTLLPHPADTQIHMFLLYCLDFPIRPPHKCILFNCLHFAVRLPAEPPFPPRLQGGSSGRLLARLSVPCHSGAPSAFARLGWVSALHRCLADSLAPCFSDTVYPCLIWTSAGHLADLLVPYKSLHCMASLHCVTLYIVVNLPATSCTIS